ncbi:MAG: glycosyltransferase [Chitinophagaceae bacterium]|nr:MAG: glycosyltransferase [Chitinophagaceae bacterium]
MNEKINILHLVKSLGRGGAEMLLQETLPYHNRDIFNFHYIYFLPWKDQMVEGIRKNGGTVENFPAKNNAVIMLQARKIARYIKRNNIQLLHCHLPWAGFVGRLVHKMTGTPVIYSEHNKQERYHILTKTINRISFNSQSHVVAVSADVAESIEKHIRPRVPVTTILNGVNVETFRRNREEGEKLKKELGIAPGAAVIGTIAVFRFQKRLKEWVSVFKMIEKQLPGTRGIIVGEGLLRGEIEEHIRNEGMEGKIILPGLQTEVKPWYSAMDIFILNC